MTTSDRFSASLLIVLTLLSAIVIISVTLYGRPARGGEQMVCHLQPADAGGWHYRTKIGGRREQCWYQGQVMKPRKELYWATDEFDLRRGPSDIPGAGSAQEHRPAPHAPAAAPVDELRRGPSSTPGVGTAQEQVDPMLSAPAAVPNEFEDRWAPVR
jgi:hypothetical protein